MELASYADSVRLASISKTKIATPIDFTNTYQISPIYKSKNMEYGLNFNKRAV